MTAEWGVRWPDDPDTIEEHPAAPTPGERVTNQHHQAAPTADDDWVAHWVALSDALHEGITQRLGDCPEMLDERGDPSGGLCHDLANLVRDEGWRCVEREGR